jgi:hypothetical protein
MYRSFVKSEELIFVGASVAPIITVLKISSAGTVKATDLKVLYNAVSNWLDCQRTTYTPT